MEVQEGKMKLGHTSLAKLQNEMLYMGGELEISKPVTHASDTTEKPMLMYAACAVL